MRRNVVLPALFAPSKVTNSPVSTETKPRMVFSPKGLTSFYFDIELIFLILFPNSTTLSLQRSSIHRAVVDRLIRELACAVQIVECDDGIHERFGSSNSAPSSSSISHRVCDGHSCTSTRLQGSALSTRHADQQRFVLRDIGVDG
jgi:hypothetical protein